MINGKKVLAVTLARGGSKKVPRKNIIDLDGRPLIEYTFDAVKGSNYIDRYVVSTDDPDIIGVALASSVDTIERPSDLASDTATSADALIHAVETIQDDYDYIVEIMATNPLKIAEDIDGVIEMLDDRESHSAVSVVRIYDHHPSRVKFLSDNGKMNDFYPEIPETRRQDLTPAAYVRNGSIYAMTKDFLLSSRSRYDKESLAYIMPEERTLNIDEPLDLIVAAAILEQRRGME
tara:strand:- start:21507 stop:22208 length:702 start_codon:yes stop_codon:yes gene_type:complete